MKKLFIAALAVCAVFASCSKDNNGGGVNGPENGGKATLSLKMTFPRTYAGESAATDAESKMNTIDVFIFNAVNGELINYKSLTDDDFTGVLGVYTSTTDIVTTAGSRKIGVGINLPADIRTMIVNTKKSIDAVDAKTAYDVTAAMIATANNFVMFSKDMPAENLVADDVATPGDNEISLTIERVAGKAAMVTTGTFDYSDEVKDLGDFETLEYKLMQTNKKSYLMRDPAGEDPNYLSSNFVVSGSLVSPQYNASAFENTASYMTLGASSSYAANYVDCPAFYGAENTSDYYQKGTTTYFMVRGQFTPKKFSNNLGATVPHSYTTGESFWVVTDGTTTHICADGVTAGGLLNNTSVFAPGSASATERVGGYCYWAVYIGNENERAFLRNNYYLGQLKAINGFGSGTEAEVILPPEGPVDGTMSSVLIDFTVLDWAFNMADEVELD